MAMTPRQRKIPPFLFLFPPATPSSPSQTLEGLYELALHPSRALYSPHKLLHELQRKKRCCQVWWARRGVPKTLSRTAIANLDCEFENTLSLRYKG